MPGTRICLVLSLLSVVRVYSLTWLAFCGVRRDLHLSYYTKEVGQYILVVTTSTETSQDAP
jgi:hydrogenase maturation factor